jgi:hypothetical protein
MHGVLLSHNRPKRGLLRPKSMQGDSTATASQKLGQGSAAKIKKPMARAAISNGSRLLATADGRSVWARIFQTTYANLIGHLGCEGYVSEPRRLIARRAAIMEVELCFWEDELAQLRKEGVRPDPTEVDNYVRWASAQRRLLEAIGFDRTSRELVPSLATYMRRELEAERVE